MRYFIIDMDGVLVEYRYKDKVFLTPEELQGKDWVLDRQPTAHIVDGLRQFSRTNLYNFHVLSVSTNEVTDRAKLEWLRRHANFIPQQNVHFVRQADDKVKYLDILFTSLQDDERIRKNPIPTRRDIIMLDDTHSILYQMEAAGFTAWHPTTFLNILYYGINTGFNTPHVN